MRSVVPVTYEHIAGVQRWLEDRGMKPWPRVMFQAPGFIVPGVAAVWIFTTPPFALVECLVSNPAATSDDRDAALDAVVTAALDYAREKGVRVVYSTTTNGAVMARAEKHGFHVVQTNAALLVADLGGGA